MKREADIIYTDILLKDIGLYVQQPDELCHKIEDAGKDTDGAYRVNIKIWLKEE